MLSIEEVKYNIINIDIKLVSYFLTIFFDYTLIQYIGKLWCTLSHEADVELKDHHSKFYFSTINQKYRQNHICSITRAFVSVKLEIRLGKVQLYCCNSVRNFEIVWAVNEHESQRFAETNKEWIRKLCVL